MGLDQFNGHTRGVLWVDERLKPIRCVEDSVLKHRDIDAAQIRHILLDAGCLQSQMLKPLPVFLNELVHPTRRVPVLNQVEPTTVSKEDAGIELLPTPLVIAPVLAR